MRGEFARVAPSTRRFNAGRHAAAREQATRAGLAGGHTPGREAFSHATPGTCSEGIDRGLEPRLMWSQNV
jgi:hypothetical protein